MALNSPVLKMKTHAPVHLRPYIDSDWSSLQSIHDRARLDELRNSVGVEAFLSLEETAASEGLLDGELWVAESNMRVVGFVAFTFDELTWLYVDPDFYRNGIGRLLLTHALSRVADEVTTEVLVGNEAALSLYLAVGFAIERTVAGKLTGNERYPATGHVLRWRRAPSIESTPLAG
jgi:ribosomal protein S18 acetylase RimI-like enzyme